MILPQWNRVRPEGGLRTIAAKRFQQLALVVLALMTLARGRAQPVKIMPLGDSITRGTNDINWPNGDIPGGYRRELATRLGNAGYSFDLVGLQSDNAAPGMDPDHNGVNGLRTDELLPLLPSFLAANPDSILMMMGTNDILQGVPVASAAENLGNLIDQITGTVPGCRLYVATIPPINQAWLGQSAAALNANADLFNDAVRGRVSQFAGAGRKVVLADMNELLVLTNADPLENFYLPGDGIHPGQAGYDQMGGLWFDAISTGGTLADPPRGGLPAAPSGLTVTVASPSRINLTWTDHAVDESVYRVRRRNAASGPWEEIAVLPAGATGHWVTGAATGAETYVFAVLASNSCGDSPWSNVASTPAHDDNAHLRPASASSVFNNLAQYAAPKANDGTLSTLWASGAGSNHFWQVDLTAGHHPQRVSVVTRQDADVPVHRKNFEIRASNDPSFASYTVLAAQGNDPLPYKATFTAELENAPTCRYVRVAKTDGTSFAVTLVKVYAADATPLPAAPDGLTAEAVDGSFVRLSWSVRSTNESGFRVERKTGAEGAYSMIATPAATTTSMMDSELSAETTYFYRMLATNESGDSPFSAEVSVTTGASPANALWAAAYPDFLNLPPADQADSADPNGDGLNNLLAYAFGLDPMLRATPDQLPGMQASSPNLFYRFRRNKSAPDLVYEVLVSSGLSGDWSVAGLDAATVADIAGEEDIEEVSVPVLLPAGETKRFFRLRVTRQ